VSPPRRIAPGVLSWATGLDKETAAQAERTARLSVVSGHVALMPDAHLGLGATIGSVIPTLRAIIPAAVGVDIGCGMVAAETSLRADDLPRNLTPLLQAIERTVPAGVGGAHRRPSPEAEQWLANHPNPRLTARQQDKALTQFGTLGSGNHFLEVDVDERGHVWVVLHSGSRGCGNELATHHIETAKKLAEKNAVQLDDRNLAYFVEGTEEFHDYVEDMHWAQQYALANRDRMTTETLRCLFDAAGTGREIRRINCHHNFAARERHGGHMVWITRKGAIRATSKDLAVIPGSMGTKSYIVRGRSEPRSYHSCAHGAGRRMSRGEARRRYSAADLEREMQGRTWRRSLARALVDEIPGAYKDIDAVMQDQRDLVEPLHTLRPILNFKGT
jgi:tRNA-splicing ligase RtcB